VTQQCSICVKLHIRDGRTDYPSVRRPSVYLFVRCVCQGRPFNGGTNHDASYKFKGRHKSGSTNKYTKFGQLIIRKIIKIIATRCHILRLKCSKFNSRRLSARPSVCFWHGRRVAATSIDRAWRRRYVVDVAWRSCVSSPDCRSLTLSLQNMYGRPITSTGYWLIIAVSHNY